MSEIENLLYIKEFGIRKVDINWRTILKMTIVITIISPIIEEIIFRGPIFWLFNEFSATAWITIIVLGLLFGLLHLRKLRPKKIRTEDIFVAVFAPDGPEKQAFLQSKDDWLVPPNTAYRIRTVIATSAYGIVFGWLVIYTNSLFSSILLHSIINTFSVILMIISYALQKNLARELS